MFSAAKLFAIALFAASSLSAHAIEIKGAGSSAAHPLYTKLLDAYARTGNVTMSYQPSGSSDGVKQIKAATVDFGASDVALSADEMRKERLICFPSAVSGVVPVVNLPGVARGALQLTGEILADIFARKVVKWNDARIVALNPGIGMPDLAIAVLVRQDGSGTTYNFSDYLSKASTGWKQAYGRNFTIAWPAGTTGAKGSSGIVKALKQTAGAIGYVDYHYVVQDKLAYARLKNRAGTFVAPAAEGFAAALANSSWIAKASYEELLTDKPGARSWPITSGTFIMVPLASTNPEKTIAALKFFSWGFVHGETIIGNANFVRLPDGVQGRIFGELTKVTDASGQPLRWSLADALNLRQ